MEAREAGGRDGGYWRYILVYSPNGHQVLWRWWTIEYINICYLWTVNLLVFAIGCRLSRVFRGQLSGGKFTVVIHEVKKKKVSFLSHRRRMNEKQLVWDQWHIVMMMSIWPGQIVIWSLSWIYFHSIQYIQRPKMIITIIDLTCPLT